MTRADTLKVIDTHDKMGNRYDMLRRNGQPIEFFSCTPEEEGAYLRRADVVIARRAEEAAYFNSVTGLQTAIVVPHFEEARFIERSYTALKNVGIVASANRINLAILQECLTTIDRELSGLSPGFTVHIAGQVRDMVPSLSPSEAEVFTRPWVRMHGFVDDIGGFYRDMDVIVSPVTMGTGINVKTVQAMAYGMPLLTTAWGCKGIETDEPLHQHADLPGIARSLLALREQPDALDRLAAVSARRYATFLDQSLSGLASLFHHPKLTHDLDEMADRGLSESPRVPRRPVGLSQTVAA